MRSPPFRSCGFPGAQARLLSSLGRTGIQRGRGGGITVAAVRLPGWLPRCKPHPGKPPPPGQTGTVGPLLLSSAAGLPSPSHPAGTLCASLWDSGSHCCLPRWLLGRCVLRSGWAEGPGRLCLWLPAAGSMGWPQVSGSRNPGDDTVPVPTQSTSRWSSW